jgi:hypothetical protein
VKDEAECKYNEEVMHVLSNLILDLVLVHHHGQTNEGHAGDDKESSQTRNVTKHQIEIALLSPSFKMKDGMESAKDENRPSTVDMKFVHVTIEKHRHWGISQETSRGSKLGNEYHDQCCVEQWPIEEEGGATKGKKKPASK